MPDSAEDIKLLARLYTLYSRRLEGQALENSFNTACEELIVSRDVKYATYIKFCAEKGITPISVKPTPKISSYASDSCGGGGGYTRGGC